MRAWLVPLAVLSGTVSGSSAMACSCAMPKAVSFELAESTAVFRGRAIVVAHSPVGGDPQWHQITEVATLEVLEVWKGDFKVGDHVQIRSSIGSGQCGRPVTNDPPSIEQVQSDGKVQPAKISGEWVIFARGHQPFEISLCSLSEPIETAADVVAELREFNQGHGT